MGTHSGNEGIIKIGGNNIAEVVSFSITETADVVEDTAKGDEWRSYKTGFKSWVGEAVVHWSETDTDGQDACVVGALGSFVLTFGGDTTGDRQHSGSAIITERNIESPEDGIVPMKISLQGNGELVQGAVP